MLLDVSIAKDMVMWRMSVAQKEMVTRLYVASVLESIKPQNAHQIMQSVSIAAEMKGMKQITQ